MTDKKTEALKLALEAIEAAIKAGDWVVDGACDPDMAIHAIREALAQSRSDEEQPAQQEPVAWKDEQGNVRMTLDSEEIQSSVGYVYSVHGERIKNACIRSDIPNGTPLYTSPPASKPWVGLTDEEMNAALDYWSEDERSAYGGAHAADGEYVSMIDTWRYIEAKLKEKNGA